MLYSAVATLLSLIFVKDIFASSLIGVLLAFIKATLLYFSWGLSVKIMRNLQLGVVTSFGFLSSIFTVIFSSFLFSENISIQTIIGIIIIAIGLFLVSKLNTNEIDKKNNYKYILILIIISLFSSFTALIDKTILSNNLISTNNLLFIFMSFIFIEYAITYIIRNKKIRVKTLIKNYPSILMGVLLVASDLIYYEAIVSPNSMISWISIIRKLSVFVAISLSSIFLKESNLFKKIIILILMLFGLLFINLY